MSHRFTMSRRVEFVDTDMAGIVHFTAYFRYMETAEHEMFRSLGLPLVDVTQSPHLGWPRVSCGFDFKEPLRYGDAFEVRIGVTSIRGRSVSYEADVVLKGKVIARGRSTSVCCEVGPGIEVRSIPIPPEVSEKLKRHMIPANEQQSKGTDGITRGPWV